MGRPDSGKPMSTTLRLDRLLGREGYTANNRRLGRLEEFRVERRGAEWVVVEYVIGAVGLIERLGLATRLILGIQGTGGHIARWGQLGLGDRRLHRAMGSAGSRPRAATTAPLPGYRTAAAVAPLIAFVCARFCET